MNDKLTIKQEKFAQEYVANGGNGTQAALAVYDTTDYKTASVIAAENLDKPCIVDTIDDIKKSMQKTLHDVLFADGLMQSVIAAAAKDAKSQEEKKSVEARKFLTEIAKIVGNSHSTINDNRKVTFKMPKQRG